MEHPRIEEMDLALKPPPPPQESQITKNWEGTETLVSVLCATYNHENYIQDAINGFLNQKTTFPFEIIIRDDASTDKTIEILMSYKKDYPNIIRLLLNSSNTYNFKRPSADLYSAATGTYVALCEGDDYWLDQQKLQKQFLLLEQQKNISIVFHDAITASDGRSLGLYQFGNKSRPLSRHELRMPIWIRTLTVMHRNLISDYPIKSDLYSLLFCSYGDALRTIALADFGEGYYLKEIMPAVYNVHQGGVWSGGSSQVKSLQTATSHLVIASYLKSIDIVASRAHFEAAALASGIPIKRSFSKVIKKLAFKFFKVLKPLIRFFINIKNYIKI